MKEFFSSKRSFEDFEKTVPQEIRPTFNELRNFCLSLGDNVVEDLRMHRIVFGKSLSFRWFADIAPADNEIIIKIQRDRKEPSKMITVTSSDLEQTKNYIKEAYAKIR